MTRLTSSLRLKLSSSKPQNWESRPYESDGVPSPDRCRLSGCGSADPCRALVRAVPGPSSSSSDWPWLDCRLRHCASLLFAFGGFTFPPRETGHWIPYLAAGAALFGGFQFWGARPVWSLVLSLFTALTFYWAQIFGDLHVLLWILSIAVVLFVSAILLQQIIEERCSGAELSLGLALSAGAGGIAILLGGSAVLGQISGTLGLILGIVALLAFSLEYNRRSGCSADLCHDFRELAAERLLICPAAVAHGDSFVDHPLGPPFRTTFGPAKTWSSSWCALSAANRCCDYGGCRSRLRFPACSS